MSAIAGIFRRDGAPVERRDIERMLAAMTRRGPDGWGIWCEGPIGLGYRKLAATPESRLEQGPLTAGRLVLAADARLDNRDEIARRFQIGHDTLAAFSDTALISRVLQERGRAGLADLVGDFAIAVWDAPARTLILARDHMGVRPIVYYASDRLLAFASDVRALLTLDTVPTRVDEGRVADFIVGDLEGLDKTSTFFEGVAKRPPAHTLEVSATRLEAARYWSLDPSIETRLGSVEEYTEAFREAFAPAVRSRLRSASAPMVTLSGGLDSSAIVAFARQVHRKVGRSLIDTLSAVSPPGLESCVETRHIRAVQQQGGVRPHDLASDQLGLLVPSLTELYATADDLFDFGMNMVHCLYALARRDGFNVVLDGVDGDLVASTASHIPALLRRGHWAAALGAARDYCRFYESAYPAHRVLLEAAGSALAPNWIRPPTRRMRSRLQAKAWGAESLIAPSLAERVALTDRALRMMQSRPAVRAASECHAHATTLDEPFLTVAIERYDRVAAAYSIEPRHPFLDRHFVQFCVSLPWDQKVAEGWTKIGLRRATAGLLPDTVRFRKSWESLGPDFVASQLRHYDQLVRLVFEERLSQLEPFVSIPKVSNAYRQYRRTGTTDGEWSELWTVLSLSVWLDLCCLGCLRTGVVRYSMRVRCSDPAAPSHFSVPPGQGSRRSRPRFSHAGANWSPTMHSSSNDRAGSYWRFRIHVECVCARPRPNDCSRENSLRTHGQTQPGSSASESSLHRRRGSSQSNWLARSYSSPGRREDASMSSRWRRPRC